MQQMCPVQYTYSMRGKLELHHADAMKKKNSSTCYDFHKRGIQEFCMWHATTLNRAGKSA